MSRQFCRIYTSALSLFTSDNDDTGIFAWYRKPFPITDQTRSVYNHKPYIKF